MNRAFKRSTSPATSTSPQSTSGLIIQLQATTIPIEITPPDCLALFGRHDACPSSPPQKYRNSSRLQDIRIAATGRAGEASHAITYNVPTAAVEEGAQSTAKKCRRSIMLSERLHKRLLRGHRRRPLSRRGGRHRTRQHSRLPLTPMATVRPQQR